MPTQDDRGRRQGGGVGHERAAAAPGLGALGGLGLPRHGGAARWPRTPLPPAAGELLLHAANNWKKDFTRVCEQLDDLRGLRRGAGGREVLPELR